MTEASIEGERMQAHVPPRTERGAVGKALDLCMALGAASHPLRLTELSAQTGLHRATALRSLSELLERQFVVKNGEGEYVLGPAVALLSRSASAHAGLAAIAHPWLNQIVVGTNMMANLQVLTYDASYVVSAAQSRRYARLPPHDGEVLPVHRAAGGLAQLAYLDSDMRAPYLRRARHAGLDDEECAELTRALQRIKGEGFAHRHGGLDSIISSVAQAILDENQRPLCALVVVGLTAELADDRLRNAQAVLATVAQKFAVEVQTLGRG